MQMEKYPPGDYLPPITLDEKLLREREAEQESNELNTNQCLDDLIEDLKPLEDWCHRLLEEVIPEMKKVYSQTKEEIHHEFQQVKDAFQNYREDFQRIIQMNEEIIKFQRATFFNVIRSDAVPASNTYSEGRADMHAFNADSSYDQSSTSFTFSDRVGGGTSGEQKN